MHTRSFDTDGRLITHRVGRDTRATAQFSGTGYPYTIASTSNRLMNAAGPVAKNYTYNAAGHPLSDGTATFTWNAAGKLATTVKSAKTHTYKTNALDQRISKNGPLSSKFFFFYDPAGQLIGEYRDNSSTATPADDWLVRQETIWLEDIPVAVIRKASATSPILVYFIHADHLNTPRVIVNQSNTPVWRWENTHAFGASLPNEDPDGNGQLFEYHPRFPGQYFDKETNLHYNYFRYYEPETGRYISPDPIGLAGGVNVFGYVAGNPMSFTDPTGEIALSAGGAVLGAILDISIQLALNGGRIECVKLESVSIAAAAGALNPFALGRAMVKVNKANRQLQRAYALRAGSRAAKRTELRSDKNRAAAIKELGSWAGIELGAEGLGNLVPNDEHVRIGNIFGNSSLQCECR